MGVEEILAKLQEIIDAADGRDLTDEEVRQYEDLEKQLGVAQRSAEIRSRQHAYQTPVKTGVKVPEKKPEDQLERAFEHYLRTGKQNQDLVELRAQEEGTPSEGGYLVPDGFRQKLVERMKAFGGLQDAVENITTESGNPLEWPTVDDTANAGEIVDEEGTFAAGADLVFGTATLGAYKYMSGGASNLPLKVSWELLQDSAFDIQSKLSGWLGTRIMRALAPHLITGTGSGQPKGIVHGTTPVQTAATTGGITYADLVAWKHSVDPAYRTNAKWAFNDTTAGLIEGIVDGNGRPLLREATDGIEGGGPVATLLGYPVVIDQAFPDFDNDDSTDHFGVFGDLSEAYVLRRVKDITLVVLNELYAANGQVGYMAWARFDGAIQNPNAYITLSGKS